ncbi:hypothetical protein H6F77_24285 [Microcoleus sp. FACHB-831]|uniref:hypothetical protein n=1 Tax=Microcoleus sp. FACHB-831 TaxID=2692827 RepID=UPI001688B014|nr:hypothetical protein [Microcoleus sp. FACHB-831]MBD1924165.1 hypothetical protein [Microcoleus sp. FACHB-831]
MITAKPDSGDLAPQILQLNPQPTLVGEAVRDRTDAFFCELKRRWFHGSKVFLALLGLYSSGEEKLTGKYRRNSL